jgi:hypothetical protein
MSVQPGEIPLHLAAREILKIHDGAGLLVRCLRGALWITQANDPDDIVIHHGQSFVVDRSGLALVNALVGPADIVIEPKSHWTRQKPHGGRHDSEPNPGPGHFCRVRLVQLLYLPGAV